MWQIKTIRRYQNRAIDGAQVIHDLIGLAHEICSAHQHGKKLGLDGTELAFYDAPADNASAIDVMGISSWRLSPPS